MKEGALIVFWFIIEPIVHKVAWQLTWLSIYWYFFWHKCKLVSVVGKIIQKKDCQLGS